MSRRGRGEGNIYERADGRWMARVDLGRGPDGRRRRKVVYGKTRQDVATKLNGLLGRAASGELLNSTTPTLADWLNLWHRTHADRWRPSTRRAYRVAIDQWIGPALGTRRLEQLKPAAIQKWINGSTENGARAKVVMAHVVLRSALAWAMTQRVLTYNPASLVRVPRPQRAPVAPLTVEQGRRLLDEAAGHRLGAMIILAMTMGLRIGEVSGLTWQDVDLPGKVLRVRQQLQPQGPGLLSLVPLKTAASRRTLALPAIAADTLQAHRVRQLEERMRAGDAWDHADDLVFTTPTGRAVHPTHVREVLAELLADAGLEAVRFHGLRHTAATWLLASGTPLFDVSRVLGHSQIGTTSDTYGHLVPEMAVGAATQMDGLLAKK